MLDIFAPYKWEALFERWPDILMAFGTTVGISVLALVIALALGIVFGVLSVSRIPVLRGITRVYVEVVQNVPLLLQVFVFYAIFPLLGLSLAAFWIGVLAIGIYHGGYIFAMMQSKRPDECARFANAVAAIKCTGIGGRAGTPNLEMVEQFLETGTFDRSLIEEKTKLYANFGV